MLTIRSKPLHSALSQAARYVQRGARVVSCTSPGNSGGVWVVTLTWGQTSGCD